MRLRVEDIKETDRAVDFREEVVELNERLAGPNIADFQVGQPVRVHLSYYRCGSDLFFEGSMSAHLSGSCARCLGSFRIHLDHPFRFVLKPATDEEPDVDGDSAFGFYSGEEVDLTSRLYEELILGLPTRPLCADDCPGLCDHCGRNRREGACTCEDARLDPWLAPLRDLKVGRS